MHQPLLPHQEIPVEYHSLIEAADTGCAAFAEADVSQAAVDVQRVQVMFKRRSHGNKVPEVRKN